MNQINAHILSQDVVVSVARDNDGFFKIHNPVAIGITVAEFVISEHKKPGIVNRVVGLARPGLQCSDGHEWLVR